METLIKIASAFNKSEEQIFLVGGAIRSEILGIPCKDYDFATSAPIDVSASILDSLGARVYPLGGERFGTCAAVLDDTTVEITTYRQEYYGNTRKPTVLFKGATLEDDLARRDFSFNAIAKNILTGELIDPHNGQQDLKNGIVRAVGDPVARMTEDPLRLLRAVRFACQYNFTIEDQTTQAIRHMAPHLCRISRERIAEEYSKILVSPKPSYGLRLLYNLRLMEHSAPQLLILQDPRVQGRYHHMNLWDHTLAVVNGVPATLELRWAALLHDSGKPDTRSEENGEIHYYLHELRSGDIAHEVLSSLKYSNATIDKVVALVRNHMAVNMYQRYWSQAAVRRLALRLGEYIEDAVLLAHFDQEAHLIHDRDDVLDFLERVRNDVPKEELQSPLDGNELMAFFHLAPGAWIKHVKQSLIEEVVEGLLDPSDKEKAYYSAGIALSKVPNYWELKKMEG